MQDLHARPAKEASGKSALSSSYSGWRGLDHRGWAAEEVTLRAVILESKNQGPVSNFEGLHMPVNIKLLAALGSEGFRSRLYCI